MGGNIHTARKRCVDNGDGTATVKLSQGYTALIDVEDMDRVSQRCWSIDLRTGNQRYAKANIDGTIYLHRYIIGEIPAGMVIDHISGDGLDNRRCNIRIATLAENARNMRAYGTQSKYKGVSRSASNLNQWRAAISDGRNSRHIGIFEDEVSAAIAYNEAAIKMHGEFALLNKIPDGAVKKVANRWLRNTSGFKGVTYDKRRGYYQIRFWNPAMRRTQSLGCFRSPIEAAIEHDRIAVELLGDKAITNAKLGLLSTQLTEEPSSC